MAAQQDIASVGIDVAFLQKQTAEALKYFQQIVDAVAKIESLKVSPGNYVDLINKQKEAITTTDKLTTAVDNLSKAQAGNATTTKATAQANSDSSKSFTQNTEAVEANVAKQKELKKELEGIAAARKQLNDFNGEVNFDNNEAAKVQIEKQLLDYSERELQIRKELSELNTQLQGNAVSDPEHFQGNDLDAAAKAKALEKEQTRQLNTELKAQAQYELATVGSINEAKAAVSLMMKERDSLNLKTEDGVKRQTELNAKIDEYNAFIKENNDLLGKQRLNVGNYPSAFGGAFTALKAELANVTKQLNDPALSGEQLKPLENEQKLLTQLVKNLGEQFNSTREELRAYQEAAKQLGLSLGDDNKLFHQFAEEVGSVKDELGDLQARINFNASDTKYIDGAIQAVNGLAGAYSAAEGAVQLFGDENEDVQKGMQKLQALIAITTGLQQVQNAIQSESAAMQTILAAKTGLLAAAKRFLGAATAQNVVATQAEAVAQTESVAATGAQVTANVELAASAEGATVAMGEEAVATEAATVATSTFAEAFAATGIGALILAVGAGLVYTISKINDYANASYKAYQANVDFTASIKDQYDTLQKQGQLIDEYNRQNVQNLQNETAISEASGQNREKQFSQNARLLDQQKQMADGRLSNLIAENEKKYSAEGLKGLDALKKAQDDYLIHYDHYLGQIQTVQGDLQKTLLDTSLSDSQKATKTEALTGLLGDLQKQADGVKAGYDVISKAQSDVASTSLDVVKNQVEQIAYLNEEERKLTLATTEFEVSNIKSRNALILSDTQSTFDERRKAIQSNANADLKQAQAQMNDVLNNPTSSNNDRLIAEKQFQEKRIEIIRTSHDAIDTENENENTRLINADKAMYDTRIKAQQEFYSKAAQDPNLSFSQQVAAFDKAQQLQQQQIVSDHEADEKIKNQSFRTNEERAADEAAFQQQLLDLAQKGAEGRLKFIEDYNKRAQAEAVAAQAAFRNAVNGTYQRDVDNNEELTQGLDNLRKNLQDRTITIDEYNRQKESLQYAHDVYDLASQADKAKKDADNDKLSFSERLAAQDKYNNAVKALNDKLTQSLEQARQSQKDAISEFKNALTDLTAALGDASYTKKLNQLQKLQDASAKYYDKEIQNIQNSTLAEQDKANKIKILEAEKAAEADLNDKKQKDIKIKQARFDKAVAVAAATATGLQTTVALFGKAAEAKAEAALLAANPLTAFYAPIAAAAAAAITVTAVISAATTAANIAKLLGAPIPAYATGTNDHKGGLAVVGEGKNKELVQMPGGDSFIADKPMMLDLPAHTKVIPLQPTDVNAMMNRSMMAQTAALMPKERKEDTAMMLMAQNATLNKQLINALKKNRPIINIQDNSAYLKWKQSRTNW